jgi:two-component system chemotaxis response regulator CheY
MTAGTVLIAEDEAHVSKTLRVVLTKAGYEVLEAADGEAAVQLMEDGKTAAAVDVLLCDLHMPRRDGMETISYFKERFPHVPIIIMTGQPDFVLTEVMRQHGVTSYLLKPVRDKKILDAVKTAVSLHKLRVQQET